MFESMQRFAQRTGLGYPLIRQMCRENKLPFVQVGQKKMICVEKALAQLEAAAEQNTKAC